MNIFARSCFRLLVFVMFVQCAGGYGELTEQSPTVSYIEDTSTYPSSSTETTSHSTTMDPCDIEQDSKECYWRHILADNDMGYVYILLKTPKILHYLTKEHYGRKPVAFYSIVDAIRSGLQLAIEECKHQFFWEPWNCPVSVNALLAGIILRTGTRQTAFLQAISAAAVMHTVTKSCSLKENELCKCGKISKKRRQRIDNMDLDYALWWGGCPDNVKFGEKVSKQFFRSDAYKEKDSKIIVLTRRHNENIGYKVVKDFDVVNCRCHGVTGSCSMRTCWTEVSNFRRIGDYLKKKHQEIVRVSNISDLQQDELKQKENLTTTIKLQLKTLNDEDVSKGDLVYFAESIDYCQINHTVGNLGPVGRECFEADNIDTGPSDRDIALSSCSMLCRRCGRGVERVEYKELYECECRDLWCCSKQCKHCTRNRVKYFCEPTVAETFIQMISFSYSNDIFVDLTDTDILAPFSCVNV